MLCPYTEYADYNVIDKKDITKNEEFICPYAEYNNNDNDKSKNAFNIRFNNEYNREDMSNNEYNREDMSNNDYESLNKTFGLPGITSLIDQDLLKKIPPNMNPLSYFNDLLKIKEPLFNNEKLVTSSGSPLPPHIDISIYRMNLKKELIYKIINKLINDYMYKKITSLNVNNIKNILDSNLFNIQLDINLISYYASLHVSLNNAINVNRVPPAPRGVPNNTYRINLHNELHNLILYLIIKNKDNIFKLLEPQSPVLPPPPQRPRRPQENVSRPYQTPYGPPQENVSRPYQTPYGPP